MFRRRLDSPWLAISKLCLPLALPSPHNHLPVRQLVRTGTIFFTMAPSATLDQEAEYKPKIAVPDFEALPERYGWPKSNERGYAIKEQLCGTPRKNFHILSHY